MPKVRTFQLQKKAFTRARAYNILALFSDISNYLNLYVENGKIINSLSFPGDRPAFRRMQWWSMFIKGKIWMVEMYACNCIRAWLLLVTYSSAVSSLHWIELKWFYPTGKSHTKGNPTTVLPLHITNRIRQNMSNYTRKENGIVALKGRGINTSHAWKLIPSLYKLWTWDLYCWTQQGHYPKQY